MKLSKYNYIFKSDILGFMLFNAETNSFAELDDSLFYQLEAIKLNQMNVSELNPEVRSTLIDAKIITSDDDNFFYYKKLRNLLQKTDSTNLALVIAPTTFCNFNCSYCFEENKKSFFMSKETEDDLIRFINNHKMIKTLTLTWYGGEPLTAFKIIKSLIERIDQETTVKLKYHSMITNGYLLDEKKSKYFSQHPLNLIQITIDGDKTTHNQRRGLTTGEGTFDTIIENLDIFFKYNDKTQVSIRVNIDSTNMAEFISVYRYLTAKWKNETLNIYPAFVRDTSEKCSNNCVILDIDGQNNFLFDMYEKYGIAIDLFPEFQLSGCGATKINSYLVGPKGELYKCWNDIGTEDKVIGNLNSVKLKNQYVLAQYLVGPTMFEDPKCIACELFPVCDGGCQWLRLKNINEGTNFNLCSNKKKYLSKFLELHYLASKQGNVSVEI